MSTTTTIDSGAFPALGIRADRKTPVWSPADPSESAHGLRVTTAQRRPVTSSHMRLVRAGDPGTAWASPPPVYSRQAMRRFMWALFALAFLRIVFL